MRSTYSFLLLLLVLACPPCLALEDDDEKGLAGSATIERKAWVSMRDGVRLSTDIYLPKDAEGPLPTIFWRTPYNYNKLRGSRSRMARRAIKNGYAFVIQNERGKFFSEGQWEILGRPRTDGYDTLDWIVAQEWSNGKVGTVGCSSSAEWQLGLAAMDHPAHAAMVPMASGAGIGRVGEFYEQGNWYRGGVFQMLFATWLYGVQNTQRPTLPADLSREDLERLSLYFDLAPKMPEVEWNDAIRHLPLIEIMENVDGPKGIYSEFIQRKPNDPAWYEGGLYHDDEGFGVPALWLNSWYDVSIGPNIALYRHVRGIEDRQVAENQFMVIAPVAHCGFFSEKKEMIVGERNFGDVRLEYDAMIFDWFDHWLKGEDNGFTEDTARVRYFTMGDNVWQEADVWPPPGIVMTPYYLSSKDGANSLYGDGRLSRELPAEAGSDRFHYDPQVPVPSLGGGVCCTGGAVQPGSFDQRKIEVRHDVLVYSGDPLDEKIEISGPIEVKLFVGSSARDTDFTLKLIDVAPDGTAWNLDETIQRVRYREGYDREAFMEPGAIYEVTLGPLVTSATFDEGHRIRIEVSSSNFPRFARNLNTGGNNYDEKDGVVAINRVHHSREHASRIVLPVVSAPAPAAIEAKTGEPEFLDNFSPTRLVPREGADEPARLPEDTTDAARFATLYFEKPIDLLAEPREDGFRILVDRNRDGDFTNDPRIELESATGPFDKKDAWQVVVPEPEPGTASIKVIVSADASMAFMFETQSRTGMLEIGEREVEFALQGQRGVYNDPYNQIYLDTDGDGEIRQDGLFVNGAYEVSEGHLYVQDRRYRFDVARDGSLLRLTEAPSEEPPPPPVSPGSPAAAFEFVDIGGKPGTVDDYRGSVVLLYFWGSWCGPCIQSLPDLIETYRDFHENGFEIVAVARKSKPSAVLELMAEYDVEWRHVLEDESNPIGELYRVRGVPDYVLIDADGTIVERGLGIDLRARLGQLVAPESAAD